MKSLVSILKNKKKENICIGGRGIGITSFIKEKTLNLKNHNSFKFRFFYFEF